MLVRGVEGGREGKEEGAESLSLTGRLLHKVADRFIVQWQGLREKYPQAEYLGQLC